MTRYPKAGKGSPWKVKELAAIPAEWKGDTISDSGGLSGEIRTRQDGSVSIRFKYGFRWQGKTVWHQCGTYPDTGIAEIRAERDKARQQVAEGINPTDAKKAARIEAQAAIAATIAAAERQAAENLTVADLFEAWLIDGVRREDGNAELRRSFAKDVLPVVGKKMIRELSKQDLLAVLRAAKKRGLNRTLVILNNDMRQMLRWAEKHKPWRGLMSDGNPADLMTPKVLDDLKLLDADYNEVRDRTLSPAEVRELRDIFAKLESDYDALPEGQKYSGIRPVNQRVQCAVWICLSTLCRIGELLMSEWQHIDLEAGTWFIPAANTKGRHRKRKDNNVTLSPFARRQFEVLHKLTGATPYVFPNTKGDGHVCTKTVSKLVGDRQCKFKNRSKPLSGRQHNDTLVLAGGANGEWTPHDLRRTGSTMMQSLGVVPDIIDLCQGHAVEAPKVRGAYQHYDYAREKAEAWRLLGERIEALLTADNVLEFRRA
ncbi:tyrosine-type recombinase/integrase [Atopomonas sediminilitoris]|uniref:tyrosine-type recombinase/integrase n=1 Tax=Atopomonas sediminilitoris TaxID=2919919 RepID=UPI001F4ED5E9|nr:site-specific integrase [Atopomonas sediminilitoris]MCJ8167681.1 tyrosine-type recombinase/integrase [Atopomonas sediminilitoris]